MKTTYIPLFKDGKLALKLVYPEYSSETDKTALSKLVTAIEAVTGEKPTALKEPAAFEKDEYVLYAGRTADSAARDIYAQLRYGEGQVKAEGNSLYFVATNASTADLLIEKLKSSLIKQDGYIYIDGSFDYKIELSEAAVDFVPYDGGESADYDGGDGTQVTRVSDTDKEQFDAYIDKLKNCGFTEYTPAREAANNKFCTYIKGNKYIYAYYLGNTSTAYINFGAIEQLPDTEENNVKGASGSVKLTMIGQDKETGGVGFLYKLADGRLIVVDGGLNRQEVKNDLFLAMRELVPTGIITVAAWYLSHPDCDHQDGAMFCLNNNRENLNVESFVFNYAPADRYDYPTFKEDGTVIPSDSASPCFPTTLWRSVVASYPLARVVKAHPGQLLKYGDAEVEVISTAENVLHYAKIDYSNSTSLVIRVSVCGTTAMLLADTTHTSGRIIEKMWGEYLKSDIVQMAHHGMWASYASLYHNIQAKIVFFNYYDYIIKNRYMASGEEVHLAPINAALSYAADVYFSNGTNTIFELPFVCKNNKDSVMG